MSKNNVITNFVFCLDNNRDKTILMTGDIVFLHENIFKDTQFYPGLKFEFEDTEYEVVALMNSYYQSAPNHIYNQENNEIYRGQPVEATFDLYIDCRKI